MKLGKESWPSEMPVEEKVGYDLSSKGRNSILTIDCVY